MIRSRYWPLPRDHRGLKKDCHLTLIDLRQWPSQGLGPLLTCVDHFLHYVPAIVRAGLKTIVKVFGFVVDFVYPRRLHHKRLTLTTAFLDMNKAALPSLMLLSLLVYISFDYIAHHVYNRYALSLREPPSSKGSGPPQKHLAFISSTYFAADTR